MAMTRADYNAIARCINATSDVAERLRKTTTHADVYSAVFPNFDRIRFIVACMGPTWCENNDPQLM